MCAGVTSCVVKEQYSLLYRTHPQSGVVGWCDGAGKTSSAGASYNWFTVGQGPTALAVGAAGGCLEIFTLIYRFSSLSLSLWETARYRLKYCLKGPLTPKQPTNQPHPQSLLVL